ncbi:uncharacterized protein DUF2752 [Flavobacteriaceae bacterium MAR_2010_72]|nr:uncharacterized protein DUF2752 [Flavobacteriaceae bacterium MAR_2010_72]TVZ59883.1 uncharacterized protein DUF2752 [Flavobacteriaceae bacterium MAR_2010_105]
MLPCLNKQLFGFECLGCGSQRSVSLLIHGEFVAAFHMYPAIYTLIPLFVLIGINFFFKFKHASKLINTLAILSVVIIIVSYIYKLTT